MNLNVKLKCATPTCSCSDLGLRICCHTSTLTLTPALRVGAEDKLLLVLCCLHFSLLAQIQMFWKSEDYRSVSKKRNIWDFSADFYTSICLFGYLTHTVEVSTNSPNVRTTVECKCVCMMEGLISTMSHFNKAYCENLVSQYAQLHLCLWILTLLKLHVDGLDCILLPNALQLICNQNADLGWWLMAASSNVWMRPSIRVCVSPD